MKKTKNNFQILFLSFIIPVIILILYFIYRKMFPFGNSSILTVDLGQQYVDFFSYYRNTILHHFGELFYSFKSSLGSGMIGTWAYYLLSPFNIILLFTPGKWITLGILIITILKISFSSLTFNIFLMKTENLNKYLNLAFSIAYSLNGFVIANMLNIMWLDALIFLPLIILGIENIFHNKKEWTYSVFLSLILIINYYMGYMICIFDIIYFIWKFTISYKNIFNKLKIIKNFMIFSLIGIGVSALVTLPTFFNLLNTKMVYNERTFMWRFEYCPLKILPKLLIGGFNFSQMPKGTPNIFVGTLVIIGIIYYFTNNYISTLEKLSTIFVIIFFVLSFCYQPLDLFWHAMQFPVWYPYRFSYIFCFWIILIASRGFIHPQRLTRIQIIIFIFFFGLILEYSFYHLNEFSFLKVKNIIISSIIIMLFLILVSIKWNKYTTFVLFLLTVLEMTLNLSLSLNNISYVNQNNFVYYIEHLNYALKGIRPPNNHFYRISKTFERSNDDPMQCNYYGIDSFNSMLNPNTSIFMQNIGIPAGDNYIDYTNGTLFTDSLLDVKYMLQNNSKILVNFSNSNRSDLDNYYLYSIKKGIKIYKNPFIFPLAFMTNSNILNVKLNIFHPIQNQNKIFESLINNFNYRLFIPYRNLNIYYCNLVDINNTYSKLNSKRISSIQMPFIPKTNNPYYLTIGSSFNDNAVNFSLNGKQIIQNSNFCHPVILNLIGKNKKDIEQNLLMTLNYNKLQIDNFGLYYLNLKRLKELSNLINRNALKIYYFSNNEIKGTVNVIKRNNILMTTIPMQKGWNIFVDGHKVLPKIVLNEFISVPLKRGYHSIVIKYKTPFLLTGILISLISITLLFLFILN